jgi:hypothetical protein
MTMQGDHSEELLERVYRRGYGLRTRRRRRQAVVSLAIVAVFLVAVAVGISQAASYRRVEVVTTPTSVGSHASSWCVPISREAAIERIKRLSTQVDPGDSVSAKLVVWSELQRMTPGNSVLTKNPMYSDDHKYWAVGVEGSVRPNGEGSGYGWGVYYVDADTGNVNGMRAGPVSSHSFFGSLSDHSDACTSERKP